jgi:aminopeptidase N
VQSAVLNGRTLPATAFAEGRIQLDGLAAENRLVVDATARYMRDGTGLHRFRDPVDGRDYLHSQFESNDAHRVYACFDQPDLKAEFTFHVVAPARWTVLSNAPAAGPPAPAADGHAVWDFLPTTRLPAFTTTVVAGDYHLVTASHDLPGGRRIPLELACRAEMAAHLDAGALFELVVWRGLSVPQVRPGVRAGAELRGQRGRGLRPGLRTVPVPVQGDRGDGGITRRHTAARDGAHVVRRPGDRAVVG